MAHTPRIHRLSFHIRAPYGEARASEQVPLLRCRASLIEHVGHDLAVDDGPGALRFQALETGDHFGELPS